MHVESIPLGIVTVTKNAINNIKRDKILYDQTFKFSYIS